MDSNLNYPGGRKVHEACNNAEIEGVRMPWNEISEENEKTLLTDGGNDGHGVLVEELDRITSVNTLPWEAPRLIGHRGLAKTLGLYD